MWPVESTVYILFYCQIEPEFQLQHKTPWTFSIVFLCYFWYNFRLYQKADPMVKLTLILKPVNANHFRWSTFPLCSFSWLLNHVIQLMLRKNYCYVTFWQNWANSQNDNYFHSKWPKGLFNFVPAYIVDGDFLLPHEIDSWNFQHMLDFRFSEASQNLGLFRQNFSCLSHVEVRYPH